jgi:ankyrin repeat protein
VNAGGEYYGSALQAAALWGEERIVKILLKEEADVNAQGGDQGSVLRAAFVRHDGIIKLLLEKGADVSAGGVKAHQYGSGK